MQYIIIGAGPAGIIAAETLRKQDAQASITVIGGEAEPPYSRMAIPYFLEQKVEQSGTYLRDPEAHYAEQQIERVQGKVSSIDAGAHRVILDDGSTRDYDKLLIATGSTPFTPPIPGRENPRVSSCWTLEDARKIIQLAAAGSNVVLIGAGFIGCIVLESLVKRGVNLTVIETGNRMVPRMLNEKAGGLLKTWCEQKGVTVKVSCSVESIADDAQGATIVNVSDGSQIAADLIITATGVKANIALPESAGLKTDQGILVNQFLQTSDADIYAAGDVAQALDLSTGEYQVQAIQPTATDHGRIAALNMSDSQTVHQGSINMNVLDTLGLVSCSFGLWMGVEGGDSVERYSPDDFRYINLQFDDDVLIGASSSGMTQHVGVLRGLIESRIHLREWKQRLMDDPGCLMEAWMARTQVI
jgi:NAD(P)H-nitrite reductase large subunit